MNLPIQPGHVLLGKYRVEGILGQGGMGLVVAARHIELGELFAIKLLHPHALQNASAVERFIREARAPARLRGEHVAKVHDVGRFENGAPYMVLEHLAGTDLKRLVQERGPLPIEEAVTYVLQASQAIAEAHSIGIVHRDIKPANLFLTHRPSGSPCVKVLDFGISKQITPDNVDLTATGSMLGSPLYMSPEQMTRTKDVDARSDIWAMGVVLFELLTGTLPFLADTVTEVVGLVLQREPVPPGQLRAGLPPELDAIVMRCLQKNLADRYQRIEELSAALAAFLHGVHSGRVSRPSLASQPGGAPWASVSPSVASTGAAWGQTGTGAGSPKRMSHRAAAITGAVLGVVAVAVGATWLAQRARRADTEVSAAAASVAATETASLAPSGPSSTVASASASPTGTAAPAAASTPAPVAQAGAVTDVVPHSVAKPPAGAMAHSVKSKGAAGGSSDAAPETTGETGAAPAAPTGTAAAEPQVQPGFVPANRTHETLY